MIMSLIRLAIGMVPVTLLAIAFFGFNLYGRSASRCGVLLQSDPDQLGGRDLVVSGLVLRNGLGAESMAWTLMFLFLPLTCVYYPVSVLPDWLQPVAWALPPTYVFEGMRALLIDHVFRADLMVRRFALNAVLFLRRFRLSCPFAQRPPQGSLLQGGE
jgi:ABC-2 type transport system permease protein